MIMVLRVVQQWLPRVLITTVIISGKDLCSSNMAIRNPCFPKSLHCIQILSKFYIEKKKKRDLPRSSMFHPNRNRHFLWGFPTAHRNSGSETCCALLEASSIMRCTADRAPVTAMPVMLKVPQENKMITTSCTTLPKERVFWEGKTNLAHRCFKMFFSEFFRCPQLNQLHYNAFWNLKRARNSRKMSKCPLFFFTDF